MEHLIFQEITNICSRIPVLQILSLQVRFDFTFIIKWTGTRNSGMHVHLALTISFPFQLIGMQLVEDFDFE